MLVFQGRSLTVVSAIWPVQIGLVISLLTLACTNPTHIHGTYLALILGLMCNHFIGTCLLNVQIHFVFYGRWRWATTCRHFTRRIILLRFTMMGFAGEEVAIFRFWNRTMVHLSPGIYNITIILIQKLIRRIWFPFLNIDLPNTNAHRFADKRDFQVLLLFVSLLLLHRLILGRRIFLLDEAWLLALTKVTSSAFRILLINVRLRVVSIAIYGSAWYRRLLVKATWSTNKSARFSRAFDLGNRFIIVFTTTSSVIIGWCHTIY